MKTIKTSFRGLKGKSVTDYCRFLIKEDCDPSLRLEVYRDYKDYPDLIVLSIWEGAKLMISEPANGNGPRFVKYAPFPKDRIGDKGQR